MSRADEVARAHWVALASTGRIGGKTVTQLLARFGSLAAVLAASPEELARVPGIGRVTAEAIAAIDLAAAEADCARFAQHSIRVITWEDADIYPTNLIRCEDAPPVLFVRGALEAAHSRAVAIVGTRTPSAGSSDLAHRIGCELAQRGWVIVSGLALGIDTMAHRGALEAGGRTIAVLGSGVQRVYPAANAALADAIADSGALLSELHPDVTVSSQNLIARNRITSGLSRAVIVVQSGEDSGSMSTARRAWQQGRAVFAVTGGDAGCQSLLAAGAQELVPGQIDWDALSELLDTIPLGQSGNISSSQLSLF